MTTIACDGLGMASDGRVCNSGSIIVAEEQPKIVALASGGLVGFSGRSRDMETFRLWLENGGDIPKLDDFSAIVLQPDGIGRFYDGNQHWTPCPFPTAIGTGAELALGAMEAGATPTEAVEIACQHDPFSGGKIIYIDLPAPPD